MEKVPMTAEGYAALEAEIKHLKTVERPRIIKAIADARTHGDLSENAEYHAAKEQQGITEARMADLEDKLSRADIIDVTRLKGDQVMFGATVTLLDEDTDDKVKYRVVGEFEMPVGALAPVQLYAPMARRHMELCGTTSRQFGEIAVATRRHAALHGNAIMTKPITIEDHQASRMIADPLRLLDCSLAPSRSSSARRSSLVTWRGGRST